ncbi:MAG: hypothetical protein AMXMBFR4_13780 [Candidatus Hydrogenedentota bacterium]
MQKRILGRDLYIPLDAYKATRRIEVRLLKRYLDVKPGEKLLDIGSGTGYWTEYLSGPAFTVGLDIMWRDTAIAARRHTTPHSVFALGDAEKLPFASGVFDKVFGVCSVEHIPDNTAAFAEFARCLKRGGVLALTLDSLNYAAISERKRQEHARMYHVAHLYDVPHITRIMNGAGFDVTHTQYLLCSPLSHWLNQVIVRNSKFQYLFFPISYPLTIFSDTYFGRKDQGWKLAVRAIKR